MPSMATAKNPTITQSSPKLSRSKFSAVNNFLISSVKFWFAISLASSISALSFFSATDFYKTHFTQLGNPFLCLISSTLTTLHFLLFLSHKPLRNSTLLHGGGVLLGVFLETVSTMAVLIITSFLFFVPDRKSVLGLLFVMCCSVDVLAIIQITRPSNDFRVMPRLMPLILSIVVFRSLYLYHFTAPMLWVSFFVVGVLLARHWLKHAVAVAAAASKEMLGDTEEEV